MTSNRRITDYNHKYFLLLMQSVINSTDIPEPTEPVDWGVIADFAVRHSLVPMLWYAIEKIPSDRKPQHSSFPYLKQIYHEQIITDINLTTETDRILSAFNKSGIRAIPVKGILTKDLYPQPFLRTMTDVDILCLDSDRKRINDFFLSEGYNKENTGEKDISYRKDKILHYEIHTSLLESKSPAYEYFLNVWDRVAFQEDYCIAKLSLEDSYIYMLEHLAHHLETGGAGVRMLMDVYLFLKRHSTFLDREYTTKVFSDILLDDFEKQIIRICENWLSGNEAPDVCSDLSQFIFNSGTYGKAEAVFLAESIRNNSDTQLKAKKQGIAKIITKIFPSPKFMRRSYNAVDKVPFLYPFFVPVYWFNRLFVKKNVKTTNINKYFTSSDSEEAIRLKAVYESLGLINRLEDL